MRRIYIDSDVIDDIELRVAKRTIARIEMKRIFIDSDKVDEDELETAEFRMELVFLHDGKEIEQPIFHEVVSFAWHEGDKAWESVKSADEIYASTSLVPLCGYGTYTGSVVVMDVMMQRAIDENITGKSIFFLRSYKDVEWDGIDLKLMPKAFKHNKLFTLEDDTFVEVNIKQLVKENK